MSYRSQLEYLPNDSRGGHESFDWIPTIDGPGEVAGFPIQTYMDAIFELAWRVKSLQITASARWTVGVDEWQAGMDVSGITSSILPDAEGIANEVNRFEDGIANPDFGSVQGTSFLNIPENPTVEGGSTASFNWAKSIDSIRRLTGRAPNVRDNVWLPAISMGLSAFDLEDPETPARSIANSGSITEAFMAAGRYSSGTYSHALRLFQDVDFPASWTLTSVSMRVDPVEFWTYAAQPGFPIYSPSTGQRLISPFQSQR